MLDDFIKGMARANMVDSHFREGIAFTLVTGVASYLCNQLPLLLLARFGSSTQAATYRVPVNGTWNGDATCGNVDSPDHSRCVE